MYNIFISHSWAYDKHYKTIVGFFNNEDNFLWDDYSVPKDDPIHNADNDDELYLAIENRMRFADCVIMPSGVYGTYSKWIQKEIEIAKALGIPIIAVEPWGSERTSIIVKENADKIVKWQANSIIQAVRSAV